jgi:hypothetical protein
MDLNLPHNAINYRSNATAESVVLFLNSVLPRFRKSVEDLLEDDVEVVLSYHLVIFLLNQPSGFLFANQPPTRKSKRTVDIGIILRSDKDNVRTHPIFTMEAKRLPNPSNTKAKEKEYVCGELGGIARFKRNQHGVDLDKRVLIENAMIGFVEKFDFKHWHMTINSWIVDCARRSNDKDIQWTDLEILGLIAMDEKMAKYKSAHIRIDGSVLILHHYFI